MIVLSGNIIELGGGSYRANLYDWDCSGDQCGYLFTASGCVPVQYHFDMIDGNASGRVYLASGQSTAINSGQSVLVYSGQLSGQKVALFSGTLSGFVSDAHVTRWRDFSPVYTNPLSGVPVVDLQFTSGGTVYLYDVQFVSGSATTITLPTALANGTSISGVSQYEYTEFSIVGGTGQGQLVLTTTAAANPRQYNVLSGTMINPCDNTSQAVILGTWRGQSGLYGMASLNSGQSVLVYSGQLSGQLVSVPSGLFVTASLNSGQSVLVYSGQLSGQPAATATVASGQVWLASGQAVSLNSGQSVLVYSGQLSGQQVNLLSGNTVAVLSGTNVNLFSGTSVLVYSGQLSGQQVTARTVSDKSGYTTGTNLDKSGYAVQSGDVFVASGTVLATVQSGTIFLASGQAVSLNSGQFVLVYSGQLSGQPSATATVASGQVWLASGQAVSLNSGQSVLVYSGQLSGQQVNLLSGNLVSVYSGTQVNVFSGQVYPHSGLIKNIITADFTQFSGILASGLSGRSLLTGVRKLTNKWDLTSTSGYLTSYMEDDALVSMQQALTAVSGAAAVTGLDTK